MSNSNYCPKVKIYTLGCKVNQYDSAAWRSALRAVGFQVGDMPADLVIVNTCSVTQKAIAKCRRVINRARRENPQAKIVAVGCLPRAYKKIEDDLEIDWQTGGRNFAALARQLKNKFFEDWTNMPLFLPTLAATNRVRYFLKIQDGCEQFCSYCIIPYARGKLKSRPVKEVITEIQAASQAGFREIVLSGVHLGLYGAERGGSLVDLLKQVVALPEVGRLRLSSIEVMEVTPPLIKLIAKERKFCRHLHIPLQSGSDRILRLMNRPYTRRQFLARVKLIKKYLPDISLTTDVIVGFPTETEKDFARTLNLCQKIGFSKLHVFPFSVHSRTPAAKLEPKVKEQIILQRAAKLRQLSAKLEEEFPRRFRGRKIWAIIESVRGNKISGVSEYYFKVDFSRHQVLSAQKIQPGELVQIKMI
ncbi:tRNA (N(6)-L-threonylcarbamoyladenosine(37)-C(2))-methylthiotransferase MtaB [Candidatus Parcubacteria bacterium]|nr:MAG: tRNA (N(6)-L-threonylcarbamoyladenosine(37)-C(2))-methylthiotransferase MtaB [Candidatus Parcubacteria bacterium]